MPTLEINATKPWPDVRSGIAAEVERRLAELFQRDKSVVSQHINNVFDEEDLRREATVAKSATVQTEGGKQVTREIEFFRFTPFWRAAHD